MESVGRPSESGVEFDECGKKDDFTLFGKQQATYNQQPWAFSGLSRNEAVVVGTLHFDKVFRELLACFRAAAYARREAVTFEADEIL